MKGYRTATHLDYAYILRLLIDGNNVFVHSLFRNDEESYLLSEISKGEYSVTADGLNGFSLEGEKCVIRITDNPIHNVEMRRGDSEWIAPEMSSVILLVPE